LSINTASLDAYKMGSFPLVGDARAILEALHERLVKAGYRTGAEYAERVRSLKAEWDRIVDDLRRVTTPDSLSQANVLGMVNDAAGPRDVVVNAAGSMPGDLLKLWRTEDPKGYHLEYGYSTMGYEIPGGLGVKMADPSREVFVMCGDGSFLMMSSEIVTAIQEGYKLIIVLVDNTGFQSIHGLQRSTGTPSFGNELRFRNPQTGRLDGPPIPIDYAKNAESFGAAAYFADSESSFREALARAKEEKGTVLIHVKVDPEKRVPGFESWWDVPVAEVSEEESVHKALAAYRAGRANQRFFY